MIFESQLSFLVQHHAWFNLFAMFACHLVVEHHHLPIGHVPRCWFKFWCIHRHSQRAINDQSRMPGSQMEGWEPHRIKNDFQSSSFSCQLTFIFAKQNLFLPGPSILRLSFFIPFSPFPPPVPHHITSQKSGLKRPRYHSSTHTMASWLVVSNVQRSNQHDPADSYCESPRTLGDRPGAGSLRVVEEGCLFHGLL